LMRRYPLVTFFLFAFGITWVVWVPRAAGTSLGVVGQASTWAPAIAALLAAALTGGRDALREADGSACPVSARSLWVNLERPLRRRRRVVALTLAERRPSRSLLHRPFGALQDVL
jgi:hypothetical protein